VQSIDPFRPNDGSTGLIGDEDLLGVEDGSAGAQCKVPGCIPL
jgi:hypothetical protein